MILPCFYASNAGNRSVFVGSSNLFLRRYLAYFSYSAHTTLGIPLLLLQQHLKDLRRPKKALRAADGPRESQTGVLVSQNGFSRYFSLPESESQDFSMRCYGIYNLPTATRTFLTLKTTEDVKQNRRARSGTPTTPSTCNYSWSDALVVNVVRNSSNPKQQGRDRSGSNLVLASSTADDLAAGTTSRTSLNSSGANGSSVNVGSLGNNPNRVGLFLSLVDYLTKTHIAKCVIPVETILPGEQYNFAIVINNEGTCLYVSLSLEPNLSFQTNLFTRHPELCSLEVLLHGVQRIRPPSIDLPDPFPSNSYLAVLHFESDLRKYIKSITTDPPKLPCQQIRLDNPQAFDTLIPSAYRISPPSAPSLYPQWNCLFELTQAVGDVFAPNAVLIVEVFEMNVPRESQGSIDFIAWTSIPLAELAQPGIRDGSIARHTSILHMNAPYMSVIEEPCEMASDCAPHEFSMLIEMRRWSSRYYATHKSRQKQKLTGMGGSVGDGLTASNSSFLNSSNPSLGQGSLVHSNPALMNSQNEVQGNGVEGPEPRIGLGHLQHALLLHNPPPQPPPRIFIDPQHGINPNTGSPVLSAAHGVPGGPNPLILIDYPTEGEHHISRSSSSEGEDEERLRSFEESDDSDEEASDDSLIEVDHDHIYGRARSNSRVHQTPRNLPRTGSMPTSVHDPRSSYGSGSLSARNAGVLSHSHNAIVQSNDSEEDENYDAGNESAEESYSGYDEIAEENGAYLHTTGNPHLDTISEATEPAMDDSMSAMDSTAQRAGSMPVGTVRAPSEAGAASSRRDSSDYADLSEAHSATASSESWSVSSKRTNQRSSLPPGSTTFSAPMLTTQSSAEQLLLSSHSSTSPLSPRSASNTIAGHPLRVSIPTLGPFNQLGPFSAGAVPTPAPGADYFGFATASPLSPDISNTPAAATFPSAIVKANQLPMPRVLSPTSPPILSPGAFTPSHALQLAHTAQVLSLASSSSSNPAVAELATPTRPRRPSIVRPGALNSGSLSGSATPSTPQAIAHLQVGSGSQMSTPKRGAPSSIPASLLGLPDIDSPEAERNRRVLELRMAELELDTTPESPEKRVLASVLPQVRHMVMRSTTSLAKATLAEQKINMLQVENLALKRQLLKLLAARKEEESSSRPTPSPSRPGRRSVGKSAAVVSVSSPASSLNGPQTTSATTTSSGSIHNSTPSSSAASGTPPQTSTSPVSSTEISPASTGEVSASNGSLNILTGAEPPQPASTPSNGVLAPLPASSTREVQFAVGDVMIEKPQEVPVVLAALDPPGSPASSGAHHNEITSDGSGLSIASSTSANLDVSSPVMPRASSSAAVILSSSSSAAGSPGPGAYPSGTPTSPITSPRRRNFTNTPSSLPTSSSSPQLSTGIKRMTSSSPLSKPTSPAPGITGSAVEFGPSSSNSPTATNTAASASITPFASASPTNLPERPEKPPIPTRKPVPSIPSRLASSGGSSSSHGSKESEMELLKEEISSWIELSDKAAKDHQRTAEQVAAKVTDDFITHIASGIERLKMESVMASGRNILASPAAPSSAHSQLPGTHSSDDSPPNIDPRLLSELKFELEKLKSELEQYQRKYLLTSAAFGEEVLLLRSKLKERKHQLQEAKKYAASLAVSAASSPIHGHIHPPSAPQTPHAPHLHSSNALTPHHSHLSHSAPLHAHHPAHSAANKHYIALSPISVPPQPAWIASMNAAAATTGHNPLASPANIASLNSSSSSGLVGTNQGGMVVPHSGAVLGLNSTSAPNLLNSGSISAAGTASLGSPLNAPQQMQFSPQTSSKQPMTRRGSGSSGLAIFLDDAPNLSANSAPQLTASGNIIHRDIPLKSPRGTGSGETLSFSSFTSPLQSPGLAHVPPPFEAQNSAPGSTKIPRG